jgi:hypothetical protein
LTPVNATHLAGETVQQAFGSLFSANNTTSAGIAISAMTATSLQGTWQYALYNSTTQSVGPWKTISKVAASSSLLLAAQDMIRFVPVGNFVGKTSLSVHAWDGTGAVSGSTVNLSKSTSTGGTTAFSSALLTANLYVNNAPTQNPPASAIALTAIHANTTSTPVAVATLLKAAGAADPDRGTALGMALTSATGPGTWQYLFGGIWHAVPATLTTTAALLLPPTASLHFVPTPNASGTAALSWVAWDQTQGTAGALLDSTAAGGAGAFSTTAATASLAVLAKSGHQPPAWSGSSATFTPVLPARTPPGDQVQTIFGPYYQGLGTPVGIAISGLTGTTSGTWSYSLDGTNWTPIGTVSTSKALLLSAGAWIRFAPKTGFAGPVTVTAYAWDGSVGQAGSRYTVGGKATALSATTIRATCVVNTAPTLTA